MGSPRGRTVQSQQQLRVRVVCTAFHNARLRWRHYYARLVVRDRQRVDDGLPCFGERGITNSRELKSRGLLSAKMRQIKFQDAEECQPTISMALKLIIPIVRTGKPAMDDSHHACSAAARLYGPFGCDATRFLFCLCDKTPRRIPFSDGGDGLHARTKVVCSSAADAFLARTWHEPRRHSWSGCDGSPDFVRRSGNFYFGFDRSSA